MIQINPPEKILLLVRRDIILLQYRIFPLISFFILILLIDLFLFFEKINWPQILLQFSPSLGNLNLNFVLIFLSSLIFPVIFNFILFEVFRYYLTYWVITNQRIISANFLGFFNVKYENVYLDRVQDITIFIKGILPSFFHFGTIRIQTAAEKGEFLLDNVHDPEVIKQVISEAYLDFRKKNL